MVFQKWKGKSMGNIAAYSVEEDGDSCFTLHLSKGYSQFSHSLQMDASDDLEKDGDEEPHLNSSIPFHPSEYIELEFDTSNNPPHMTTTSGFPNSVLDSDNDNGNSKLCFGGETGVDGHVHQGQSLNAENGHANDTKLFECKNDLKKAEESLNTGNEHTDDAKLSESIYVLEKPEQSLNNGNGHTYATLSRSNHVLEEPEQSFNRGNKNTEDAKLSEPIHVLEEPEQLLNTRNEHIDYAKLSESNHVLDEPEYSSHNDDNKKAQLHLDETTTVTT